MIRFQIIEQDGAHLYQTLLTAMREGDLRTFRSEKRGRKVVHARYPGWITWAHSRGLIDGVVFSPKRQGNEWQIFSALIGRLAHRYAGSIAEISVRFPSEPARAVRRRRKKRAGR